MDLVGLLSNFDFLWNTVLPFLVALTILVFVHEMGHYSVARWCKVRVEVFAVGFGSELKGWTDKSGTRWKICAIPLGGYVKMFGESEKIKDKDGDDERPMTKEEVAVSFHHKSLWQRSAIVFAGPFINFLFAVFAFALLFIFAGVPQIDPDKPLPAVVGGISAGSAADKAGLQRGDRFLGVGDQKIKEFSDLQRIIGANPGSVVSLRINRSGKIFTVSAIPTPREITDKSGNKVLRGILGVTADPGEISYVKHGVFQSIWLGVERTYFMSARILEFVRDIFIGDQSAKELGGVLRIAQISGQVAELGLAYFVSFIAVLSVNLGIINLFPIPLLDGGHLAFYAVEAIRGRPLGEKAQEYGFRFGLVFVVALFLFVTWNDLVQLKFFEFISKLLT